MHGTFIPKNFTVTHFISLKLQNKITSHKSCQFTPHHYTSHHFSYLHSISTWIPLLVTTFLTLFLNVFSLQGKDASKPAVNWFQLLMDCVAHWRISMRFRYNGGLVNGELCRMVCPGSTVDTRHVDSEQTADWLFYVGVVKAPQFDSHEFLNPALPSSYRAISFLDTIGKLFEKILLVRILHVVNERGLMRDEQFGFRPRHSSPYSWPASWKE